MICRMRCHTTYPESDKKRKSYYKCLFHETSIENNWNKKIKLEKEEKKFSSFFFIGRRDEKFESVFDRRIEPVII